MDEIPVEEELRVWRAEREISRVILRYARAVDTRDFDAVTACFHPHAVVHYGDWFSGTRDEAIDFLRNSIPNLRSTLHVFGTPWIEIDLAADTAEVETYAVNSATYPPGDDGLSVQNVSGTRYLDRFEKKAGRWAIAERRNRRVWAHNLPDTDEPAVPVAPVAPIAPINPAPPRE